MLSTVHGNDISRKIMLMLNTTFIWLPTSDVQKVNIFDYSSQLLLLLIVVIFQAIENFMELNPILPNHTSCYIFVVNFAS